MIACPFRLVPSPRCRELHRAVSQLREDLRGDLAHLAARLDQVVTHDVYQADQRATLQRIDQLETSLTALRSEHEQYTERMDRQRREDAAHADATRRLVISAFIAPLIMLLLCSCGWLRAVPLRRERAALSSLNFGARGEKEHRSWLPPFQQIGWLPCCAPRAFASLSAPAGEPTTATTRGSGALFMG